MRCSRQQLHAILLGQKLVREERIIAALHAKEACDRILDLGVAIIEGGLDGVQAALITTTHLAAGALRLAVLDQETINKVHSAFQQATLATEQLVLSLMKVQHCFLAVMRLHS